MTTDAQQQPSVINVHDEGHVVGVGGDNLSWTVVADEETDLAVLHVHGNGKVQSTELFTSSDLLPFAAAIAKANGLKLVPDTLLRSGRWEVDAFDGSWSIWDRLNGTFVPGHAYGDRADAEAAVDRFYAEGRT